MIRSKSDFIDALPALLLSLTHLLLTLPWLYRNGAGEPDSVAMIAGIYQGLLKQTYFDEGLYMLMGQPLYYGFFFALPVTKYLTFDHLALLMNVISWVTSAASTGLVYLLARNFATRSAAALGAAFLISSPTVLEWSTYAHPVTVSIFLLLCAANIVAKVLCRNHNYHERTYLSLRQYLYLIAAALLAGAAICVRADVIVLFHLFPLIPFLAVAVNDEARSNRTPWLPMFVGCGVAVLAVVIGFIGLAPFTGSAQGGNSSPTALFLKVQAFFTFIPMHDVILELLFGIGIVGSFYALATGAALAVKRRWKIILFAFLLVAPPLIFAMGNPQPARRFMHAIYASYIAIPILTILPGPWRRITVPMWAVVGCGLTAVVVNILILPATGDFLRRNHYAVVEKTFLSRATSSLLNHHSANQKYLFLVEDQMDYIRRLAPDESMLVGTYAHVQFLVASFSRDHKPVNVQMIDQAPGLIKTRVTSGEQTFTVVEYLPQFSSYPPTLNYPAIYAFTNVLPNTDSTTAPVYNLAPPDGLEFQMWYRARK